MCLFLFRAVNSFAVTVVGHPIHYLVRKKEKKLVNFLHVKKDDYSANDRLFSLLNGCAHLPKCQFFNANAMFDSEFYHR